MQHFFCVGIFPADLFRRLSQFFYIGLCILSAFICGCFSSASICWCAVFFPADFRRFVPQIIADFLNDSFSFISVYLRCFSSASICGSVLFFDGVEVFLPAFITKHSS